MSKEAVLNRGSGTLSDKVTSEQKRWWNEGEKNGEQTFQIQEDSVHGSPDSQPTAAEEQQEG